MLNQTSDNNLIVTVCNLLSIFIVFCKLKCCLMSCSCEFVSFLVIWIYVSVCLHELHSVPLLQPVMVNYCKWEVAFAEPQGDTLSLRAVSHRPGLLRKRSVGIRGPAPPGSKVTMFRWLRSNSWFLNGLGQHVFPIWYGWKSDLNLGG